MQFYVHTLLSFFLLKPPFILIILPSKCYNSIRVLDVNIDSYNFHISSLSNFTSTTIRDKLSDNIIDKDINPISTRIVIIDIT